MDVNSNSAVEDAGTRVAQQNQNSSPAELYKPELVVAGGQLVSETWTSPTDKEHTAKYMATIQVKQNSAGSQPLQITVNGQPVTILINICSEAADVDGMSG